MDATFFSFRELSYQVFLPFIIIFLWASILYGESNPPCTDTTAIERQMTNAGLVNVRSLDSTIIVELKYSTADNFLHEDVYGDLCNCYLRKEVAIKLVKSQGFLREKYPQYSLLVLDCVRPRSIQQRMWDSVKVKPKEIYVANPHKGSIHNYGCAVDITIADSTGRGIDMGTPFDFFGDLAQPRYEDMFLKQGKLSKKQIDNRKSLREVMVRAGFKAFDLEWWHFNAFPTNVVKSRYSIIE